MSPEKSRTSKVDLIELFQLLLKRKFTLIKFLIVSIIVGVFVAYFYPANYTSSLIIVSKGSTPSFGGRLGGLATLAGINLNKDDGSFIYPDLYPEVIRSYDFRQQLLNTEFKNPIKSDSINLKEYYLNYYKPPFHKRIIRSIKGIFKGNKEVDSIGAPSISQDYVMLSSEERGYFDWVGTSLRVQYDGDLSYVKLLFTSKNPQLSAQAVTISKDILIQSLIDFKVKNLRSELEYVKSLLDSSRIEYLDIQDRLAKFRDANQAIQSETKLADLRNLEADYNLAFNLYSELNLQYEQTKINLKKEVPSITAINQAMVPANRDGPSSILIIIGLSILGVGIGFTVIVGQYIFKNYWT